jgi:hypothetical protein
MSLVGSAVKLAAVFGAGVATAIIFLSGPVERPSPPSSVERPVIFSVTACYRKLNIRTGTGSIAEASGWDHSYSPTG